MNVCRVWCEWDIGQEDVLFASQEAAEKWVDYALELQDFTETREELENEHLIRYEWKKVIQ